MNHKLNLSIASLKLKNAAPEQWDAFLIAFTEYADYMNFIVAEADASQIMVAKGFALQCRDLHKIFQECEAREKQRSNAPAAGPQAQ